MYFALYRTPIRFPFNSCARWLQSSIFKPQAPWFQIILQLACALLCKGYFLTPSPQFVNFIVVRRANQSEAPYEAVWANGFRSLGKTALGSGSGKVQKLRLAALARDMNALDLEFLAFFPPADSSNMAPFFHLMGSNKRNRPWTPWTLGGHVCDRTWTGRDLGIGTVQVQIAARLESGCISSSTPCYPQRPGAQLSPTSYQAPPESPLSPHDHLAYAFAADSYTITTITAISISISPASDISCRNGCLRRYLHLHHNLPNRYNISILLTPSKSQISTSYLHNQPPSNQPVESKLSFVSAAPVSLAQSPPPTQYQPPTLQPPVTEPPVAPTLARANSLSYPSTTPVSHLARNNTITSHAHTHTSRMTRISINNSNTNLPLQIYPRETFWQSVQSWVTEDTAVWKA